MPKKKLSDEDNPNIVWLSKCKDKSNNIWLPTDTGYVGGGELNKENKTSPLIINRYYNPNPSTTESNIHDTEICGGEVLIKELKDIRKNGLQTKVNKLHGKLSKKDETLVKRIVDDSEVTEFAITSKCIKVTPVNFESKHKINDAIAASRKIYNLCVHESHIYPKGIKMTSLRSKFVEEKNMTDKFKKDLEWTFRTPQKIRAAVPARFCANFSTAKKELKKNPYRCKKLKNGETQKIKKKIQMRFKDTDKEKQIIYLSNELSEFRICEETGKTILKAFSEVELILDEKYDNFDTSTKCMNCQNVFVNKDGYEKHLKIKKPCKAQPLIKSGRPQAEIILQRIGYDYYIYVPEYKQLEINEAAPYDIVAVDVGLNTMLTYYSPDTEWGEICPGMKQRVDKIRKKIDKLKLLHAKQKEENPQKKRGFKKAFDKRIRYIKNMVDDIHWKMSHWLLSKFRKIVISRLYVSKCDKSTKQSFADLRLCKFVDRLTQKSMEYANSEIHICKEHYTSQACTRCLSLNTVKDSTVRCKNCKLEIHRDLNGARNIYLKHCY